MRKQYWFTLGAAALMSVMSLGAVAAQDKVALKIGEFVNGEITEDVGEVLYSFSGTAGTIVTLEALPDTEAPDLDPTVELRNADGETIALNDDFSYPIALVIAELPADGEYVAVVGRAGGDEGTSNGAFSLRVNEIELVGPGSTINAEVASDFDAPQLFYVMRPEATGPVTLNFSQEIGENYAGLRVLEWSSDSYPDTLASLDSTSKLSNATLTIEVEEGTFYVLQIQQTSYSFTDSVEFPVTVEIN